MNSKKCENFMNSFFELDKGERLPFKSSLHILFCKNCRTKVRLLSKAQSIAQRAIIQKSVINEQNLSQLIENTRPSWLEHLKPVSMTRWVCAGIFMILLFVVSGMFLQRSQNQTYLMSFFVIVGGAVTAYCAAFIGVNLDFFIKKIDTKNLALDSYF